jgi:hypothetical protein
MNSAMLPEWFRAARSTGSAARNGHAPPRREMPVAQLAGHLPEQGVVGGGRKDAIGPQVVQRGQVRRGEGLARIAACGNKGRHERQKDEATRVGDALRHDRTRGDGPHQL